MPSKRQQAANRRNAQKSTGPNSEKGKATSSLNAVRHGLSSKSAYDPETEALVNKLAREFLDAAKRDIVATDLAREAAEAQVQLQRIQNLKRQSWGPCASGAKIKERGEFWLLPHLIPEGNIKAETVELIKIIKLLIPHTLEEPFGSEEEMDLAFKLAAVKRLQSLIRYERQFANRRDRALRALTEHTS